MDIAWISEPNADNGICGFCSAFAARYLNDPAYKATLSQLTGRTELNNLIVSEMAAFIYNLENTNPDMLNEITEFTKTFGGKHAQFNHTLWLQVATGIANKLGQVALDVAMTPDAMIYYLKSVCNFNNAALVDQHTGQCINGLGTGDGFLRRQPYKGLRHWVYNWGNDQILNYGEIGTLEEVKRQYGWDVVYTITW